MVMNPLLLCKSYARSLRRPFGEAQHSPLVLGAFIYACSYSIQRALEVLSVTDILTTATIALPQLNFAFVSSWGSP